MTQNGWRKQFEELCQQGSTDGIIKLLSSQATSHAGTANANVKNQAIKLLTEQYKDQPVRLYQLALRLCNSKDPTAQEVGVIILGEYYKGNENEINATLLRLAKSDNWEVREWVASACGLILEKHFHGFFPVMENWLKDESENVRRAAILGIMYAGKGRNPEFADPFLDALEPLLSDRSRYVRDNLGPFAIGNALIKYYPKQVLRRLDKWVEDDDEQVRWNVAMIFSAAEGAKFAKEAKHIIAVLLSDERPYVKRAINKAIKNINKRGFILE